MVSLPLVGGIKDIPRHPGDQDKHWILKSICFDLAATGDTRQNERLWCLSTKSRVYDRQPSLCKSDLQWICCYVYTSHNKQCGSLSTFYWLKLCALRKQTPGSNRSRSLINSSCVYSRLCSVIEAYKTPGLLVKVLQYTISLDSWHCCVYLVSHPNSLPNPRSTSLSSSLLPLPGLPGCPPLTPERKHAQGATQDQQ